MNDLYATFLPVMEAVLSVMEKVLGEVHAIEYGGGKYSTPLLIERCVSVVTIEHDDKWRERLKEAHSGAENWALEEVADPAGAGLVFVDGQKEERVRAANGAFRAGVPVVIVHDTEKSAYYWYHRLDPGDGYVRFDYTTNDQHRKQTTVFAHPPVASQLESIRPEGHVRV